MGIYYRIKGKIIAIDGDGLALENNGIAYEIATSRPFDMKMDEEVSLFIHEVIAEDDHYLIGFRSREEKEAFLSLISVKGIGPKTALSALKATTPEALFAAVESNNTGYLKKLPGIGPKAAAQIILDLRGKLAYSGEKKEEKDDYNEARAALKTLGFKSKDIDEALKHLNLPTGASNEEVLRLALRALKKGA